jgi:uncharacterized protein
MRLEDGSVALLSQSGDCLAQEFPGGRRRQQPVDQDRFRPSRFCHGTTSHENSGAASSLLAMLTNVLGTNLRSCCSDPATGFYRDGYCRTGPEDTGLHTVCAKMTRDFLDYSVLMGNDLVTPHPEWGFAGLEPGDRWCICVTRWKEALERGVAPPVDLEATHSSALEFVSLEELQPHALE